MSPALPARPLRRRCRIALALLASGACALAAGCATGSSGQAATSSAHAAVTTYVIVRHAEKAADDPRDPSLSAAGQARAARLARLLADGTLAQAPLAAAYATQFRRTRQTAAPAAAARGIPVTSYDAALPGDALAGQLRLGPAGGTVLVVGHSNTVPGIVAALCGCAVAPIGDADYDNLYRVRIDARGAASMAHSRY